jgi:Phage related hypothetical protein (DUF1799)
MGEDYGGSCDVWGDNWDAFRLFESMSTQWRVGVFGATGLDYGVLPGVMRMMGIAAKECSDLFRDVRVMEAAALAVMSEQAQDK